MVRSKKINQQNSTGFVCANKKNQLGNTVEEKTSLINTIQKTEYLGISLKETCKATYTF